MLYSWHSAALKNYGAGRLIATAENPDAARAKIRAAIPEWIQENREWLLGPEDSEELAALLALFESDIAGPPTLSEALLIPGSE